MYATKVINAIFFTRFFSEKMLFVLGKRSKKIIVLYMRFIDILDTIHHAIDRITHTTQVFSVSIQKSSIDYKTMNEIKREILKTFFRTEYD